METIQISLLIPSSYSENIYSSVPSQDFIQSIKNNGVLLPIWITSQNVIISGHRRVNACKALSIPEIPYEVKEYSDLLVIESNRYRVKTTTEILREAEALEKIYKPLAKENQGTRTDICHNSDKSSPPIDTKKEVSAQVGISHDTLHKLKAIEKVKPELLTEVDEGKLSINSAYNQVKIAKQKEERLTNKPLPFLTQGKYRTIVIDPPWPVEKILREERPNQGAFDYPTMTIEQIKDLPINNLADPEGCHVYLWTTHKFLPVAFDIFQTWG